MLTISCPGCLNTVRKLVAATSDSVNSLLTSLVISSISFIFFLFYFLLFGFQKNIENIFVCFGFLNANPKASLESKKALFVRSKFQAMWWKNSKIQTRILFCFVFIFILRDIYNPDYSFKTILTFFYFYEVLILCDTWHSNIGMVNY